MLPLAAAARTRTIKTVTTLCRPAYSTTHGNDPKGGLIDNAPGWREDLATVSEASVKADRDTATMDEMQQKTVDYAQSHQHDPEGEQTHATYARDQVNGPLGNAGVGEFEGVVGNDDLGPDDAQVESDGRVVMRRVIYEKKTVYEGGPGAGQANV